VRLLGGKLLQLVPAFVVAAAIAAAAGPAIAEPQPKDAQPKDPWPPMVFYVAKGDPNACGDGCREWIVAEGTIDRDAAARLRSLLNRLGKRKLPIYFHSPGGSVNGGLAIGRLMRERRMTAGVGRTIPVGCDPTKRQEAACDALKGSGRELLAELRTARTLCNSSCVYALIGGAVREVGAGARIGVHEIALRKLDERGMPAPAVDRKSLSSEQLKQIKAQEAQIVRYIGEMGIDKALFDAAAQISYERVRFLSLDEIARFGIDRREFHESRWMVDEGPPGPLAVIKFVVEAKGGEKGSEPKQYRTTRIRLTCRRPGEVWVQYSRELAPADKPASMAVTARGDVFVLPPARGKPKLGYNEVEIDDRAARVPIAFFEEAAAGDAIDIKQAPDAATPEKVPPSTRLSTAGLSASVGVLAQQCSRP
jgi:hypothetical protein